LIDGMEPLRKRAYVCARPNPVISVESRGVSVARLSLRFLMRGCFGPAGILLDVTFFDGWSATFVGDMLKLPVISCELGIAI
jgi:hypothetical protein